MRTLKIVLIALLTVAGLAGCGLVGHDDRSSQDAKIEKTIEENPFFSVLLRFDVSDAQRINIGTVLRALPSVKKVTYLDHQAAYQEMKQRFSTEPSEMPSIDPRYLPENFRVDMTDIAAVRRVRDNPAPLNSLPGVQEVVFGCLSARECRQRSTHAPAVRPS